MLCYGARWRCQILDWKWKYVSKLIINTSSFAAEYINTPYSTMIEAIVTQLNNLSLKLRMHTKYCTYS